MNNNDLLRKLKMLTGDSIFEVYNRNDDNTNDVDNTDNDVGIDVDTNKKSSVINNKVGNISIKLSIHFSGKLENTLLVYDVVNYKVEEYAISFYNDGTISGGIMSRKYIFDIERPEVPERAILEIPLNFDDKYDMEYLFSMLKIPNDQYNQYISIVDLFDKVKTINVTIKGDLELNWSYIVDFDKSDIEFTAIKIKSIKNDEIYIGGFKLKSYKPIYKLFVPKISTDKIKQLLQVIYDIGQEQKQ